MQKITPREVPYLELVIVLALLALTLKYRSDLEEALALNASHELRLAQLAKFVTTLQGQHKELEDYYHNNYQLVVSIVKNDLKRIQHQLDKVTQTYRLNNQLYHSREELSTLSPHQRLLRLQNILAEESQLLEYMQEMVKEKVREVKFNKMEALAKDPYFHHESMRSNWQLLKGNVKSVFATEAQLKQLEKYSQKEEVRLEKEYNLSKYGDELPFCIIVPSYNNAKNFRYEYNLQSILNQDYSNYHVVIVDDASPDLTGLHIQRFLHKNLIPESKVTLIRNQKQVTAVPNIHTAVTQHCKPDQIGFFVDGDDELVGVKAFKIFNAIYQSKQPAMAYSIAFQYWTGDQLVKDNWSQEYTLEDKKNNRYRDVPQKISHLRSFRIDLYLQIREADLKDENGEWFTSTYDEVVCLPMLEMSCGKIEVIPEYLYLYIFGTGYNDRLVDKDLQGSIARKVKNTMKKYECDPRFQQPL